MSNAVATLANHQADRPRRDVTPTDDAVPMLDTAKFEHMQRISNVMASTSMIPDTLRKVKVGQDTIDLSPAQVMANCFLVVNQAVRWGMDPFAVAQCVSIVHGKLCYEGKLVSAVLDAKLGLKLHHHLVGAPGDARRIYLSDRPFDESIIAQLTPGIRFTDRRIFDGSVGEWKTTGAGTPWSPKNFDRMLIYRGTRDWCRIYEPAIMLGVYTPDEMLDLSENARAERAREINRPSLQDRIALRANESVDRREGFGHEQARLANSATDESQADRHETFDEEATPEAEEPETVGEVEIDPDTPAAELDVSQFDDAQRSRLTRYCRDVLTQATGDGDAGLLRDRIGKTHTRWKADMGSWSAEEKAVAERAFKAAQAVARGDTDLSSAVTFVSGEIGVEEAAVTPSAA